MFWNYEFDWAIGAGSIHDWKNFQLTKVGQKCIKGEYLPYKLIENVAYLIQSWMYSPFKRGGDTRLEDYKANWNFFIAQLPCVLNELLRS